jgi:cyclic pyranopterin phosphate synthase
VLAAIDRCLEAGLKVKLNMVPVRTGNRDQIVPMLRYAQQRGIELRYIELMRMGHLSHSAAFDRDFLGMEEILELIGDETSFERTDAPFDSTARRFALADGGVFGIIPNESEPFCSACTRLRLSSEGMLYGCLSSSAHQAFRPLLELPKDEALARLPALLEDTLKAKQPVAFTGGAMVMKFIGG